MITEIINTDVVVNETMEVCDWTTIKNNQGFYKLYAEGVAYDYYFISNGYGSVIFLTENNEIMTDDLLGVWSDKQFVRCTGLLNLKITSI